MRRGRYTRAVMPPRRRRGGALRQQIIPSVLTSYDTNADQNSYTTPDSITIPAMTFAVLWLVQTGTGPTGAASFSGAGTWTLITSRTSGSFWTGCYRTMQPAESAGQVTVNFNADEATTGVQISIIKYVGAKRSGTNGADAVSQFDNAVATATTSTTTSVPNPLGHVNNYMAYGIQHNADEDTEVGAAPTPIFTRRANLHHATPSCAFMVADKRNRRTDTPSWATAVICRWTAIEIAAG